MQEGVANAAPSVASMPAKVPVVLALFSADSINIPDVPMFTTKDNEDFNKQWICDQLAPLDLCDMQLPYPVSAGPWLWFMNALPAVIPSFGRFMADFLGSTEYNSSAGKAQSTLSGLDLMTSKLRGMVVAPENTLVELTTKDIAQKVTNAKQRGHERTYAHTYMRVCMHVVRCGVMVFHNTSSIQCAISSGHLEGLFCKGSIGAWGMAPNKSSIQPDLLGSGTVGLQATGF